MEGLRTRLRCKPLIAAVVNGIYDATGVRVHRPPFRKEHVLETLKASTA